MAFLLSTEAFMAILRPEEDDHPVIQWKRTVRNETVFVSVVSIGEARNSINLLPSDRRLEKDKYERNLDQVLPNEFHNRILPVDLRTAKEWGLIRYVLDSDGMPIYTEEALIIATARVSDYSYVAERKPYHAKLGVKVIDPYERAAS